jgi:cell filamentation protein, protein adenylyltransferase
LEAPQAYKSRSLMVRGRPSRDSVYERLNVQIGELRERLGGLPTPSEATDIWRGIWFEEAHHSTAIEGNTLVMKQVEALLAEGRAVGDKQLREYLEVKGYADAARWVYSQASEPGDWHDGRLVTLTEIRHIHEIALGPAWDVEPHPQATADEGPGGFRRHEIQAFPGGMRPPPWTDVPTQMRDWVRRAGALQPRTRSFPDEVAHLHASFERIHPFLDGNGRVGRLVLNLLLARLGYPPAIIYKKQRDAYLRALRRSDAGNDADLGELVARAILDNLYRFVIPAVAGPARLVPLAALADERISASALRIAAIRGRLQATKGADGQWRSSRAWVDAYLAIRHKRVL